MHHCRVISVIVVLVLVLTLGSWRTLSAYAEQAQQANEHASEMVPQGQQRQDIPLVSTTRPPESTTTSNSRRAVEAALSRVTTKLALDLGVIHQPEKDAWGALERVGISPKNGWSRTTELTPEVFYEVLAAARRAASTGNLSMSADGA